jgi:Protein kinase domain
MKSSMIEATAKNCPTCCRPLPSGAPAGLCPACLLAQGVETESGAGGERTRFVPPTLAEVAALFPQLEILRLLGAGGMGAVYQARQPALDRFVALKVLPAGGNGVNFEGRFNREARALARLSHPNIVAVHEFGQAGALHYFLMEYVDGTNLRQLEQASRLSAREALQLIPQICDALQYAHDEGVVHRDIKPENVLVDRKGRVKVADFGLAKILGHDPEATRLTVEGQVMGTPHYMAPEQVERPLAVDHRADIYSLGVVFYEMLTGDLPLGNFAPPSRKVQVDVRLDEIVLRALENDPARRYQQASEVKSGVATVVETPDDSSTSAASPTEAEEDAPKHGVRYLRWLGIPVVVERDGARKVYFPGALAASLLTATVGFVAHVVVHWLAGTDHAAGNFSWLVVGLTALFGVWQPIFQAGLGKPRHSERGTLIVPTLKRSVLQSGYLSLVVMFLVVVGSHFLKTRIINPRLAGSSGVQASQTAQLDPATGTSLVRHPGGGTAELLGISAPDSATNGWWQADGTQTRFTLGVREVAEPSATNALLRNFVLQFAGLMRDTVERIEFDSALASSGHSGADEVIRDGKSVVTDARRYRVSFPADLTKTRIRIAWGIGDWQTALSMTGPIWRESPQGGVFNAQGRLKFVGVPALAGDELQVSYLYGRRNPLWSHRLVAIDQQGREHDSHGGTGTGTGGGADQDMVFVMQFRDLALADVKEFRLQSRPIQWVEFPDVALNPKVPLPRREQLRLAEPMERTFDDLIDFDTGGLATYQAGATERAGRGGDLFEGAADTLAWMRQNGFDAKAGTDQLQVVDMEVVPLENGDWETLPAPELIDRLNTRSSRPLFLRPNPGGPLATYGFRTRERGVGILRLGAFHPQESKATVSYKRVLSFPVHQRTAPPVAALELRPVLAPADSTTTFEILKTVDGQPIRVAMTPWLRGDAFAGAGWRIDPVSNTRVIVLRLKDSGRREFARLSAEHVGEQVALILAGRVLSAPQIAAPMDVATLELGGLDRERGRFLELLAALNLRPDNVDPISFGEEREADLLNSSGGEHHWWNLAEARATSVARAEPSSREYHEARRGAGGDLEALGDNPVPVVSGYDLTVVPLVGDGKIPTALEIAYRWELQHQEPEPENLLPPGTYAIRTRRGSIGLLEVLGWALDRTGVRIRYREVLNSSPAP